MAYKQEGKTYGNAFLFRALVWSIRHFGVRPFYIFAYVCLVPVAMIFILFTLSFDEQKC